MSHERIEQIKGEIEALTRELDKLEKQTMEVYNIIIKRVSRDCVRIGLSDNVVRGEPNCDPVFSTNHPDMPNRTSTLLTNREAEQLIEALQNLLED